MEENIRIKKEQQRLAESIVIRDDFSKTELVAGVDTIIVNNEKIIAAIIICDKGFKIVDKANSIQDIRKNVIFKNGPVIIDAYNKLKTRPDVILVDGEGITHSRLGLASYVGLALNMPTIGVSTNLQRGKVIDGLVYVENEIRGYELLTREGSRPVYISPGHKVSLKSSLSIVKDSIKWPHKLPEPLALAHKYLNKIKKDL